MKVPHVPTICIPVSALILAACAPPGIGDPCIPESIPSGGFAVSEVYVEAPSVECESRVCLVYQLERIPFGAEGCETASEATGNPACASQAATEERAYCTCACDAPPGETIGLCDCPERFTCVPVLGDRAYCVRESALVSGL